MVSQRWTRVSDFGDLPDGDGWTCRVSDGRKTKTVIIRNRRSHPLVANASALDGALQRVFSRRRLPDSVYLVDDFGPAARRGRSPLLLATHLGRLRTIATQVSRRGPAWFRRSNTARGPKDGG